MIKLIIVSVILSILSLECNRNNEDSLSKIKWPERGYNSDSEVGPGVIAYNAAEIDYLKDQKTILEVRLEEPVVVQVADKEEKWGFFQFPIIYRGLDNKVVIRWNMAPDDVKSYGQYNELYSISEDNGKSWSKPQKEIVPGDGLVLPDGDRIAIYTPKAIRIKDLMLPDPVVVDNAGNNREVAYYKLMELPDTIQGIYLSRIVKGTNSLKIEHNVLNDPVSLRSTSAGMFPVTWWGDMHLTHNGSIIAGIYPGYLLGEDGTVERGGISFYRSDDKGLTWNVQGRISVPDKSSEITKKKIPSGCFYEPGFEILSDKSFLCVLRTGDVSPMYLSRSTDEGRTWSKPVPFTPNGVLPRLLQLENGVMVLSSGRPGVQLRFCIDGKGENWTDPFEMMPFNYNKVDIYSPYQETCGYTGLLSTGPDSFLLVYSDFKYKAITGEMRKAIKVRQIKVTPKIKSGENNR